MPWLEYPVLFASVASALLFIGIKFVQMRRLAISGEYSRRRAGVIYFFTTVLSPFFVMVVVWLISTLVERREEPFRHSVFIGEPGLLAWFAVALVAAVVLVANAAFVITVLFVRPNDRAADP